MLFSHLNLFWTLLEFYFPKGRPILIPKQLLSMMFLPEQQFPRLFIWMNFSFLETLPGKLFQKVLEILKSSRIKKLQSKVATKTVYKLGTQKILARKCKTLLPIILRMPKNYCFIVQHQIPCTLKYPYTFWSKYFFIMYTES